MKNEKLSDVDAYRAACVVVSIGFYFLGKFLVTSLQHAIILVLIPLKVEYSFLDRVKKVKK